MASSLQVWTWLLNDLDRFSDDDDDDDFFHWEERDYVTDVFNRHRQPPPGSVLLGYETTRGTPRLLTLGQVASYSGVATGRIRATIKPLFHHADTPLSAIVRRLPNRYRSQIKECFTAQSLEPRKTDRDEGALLLDAYSRAVAGSRAWLDRIRLGGLRVTGDAGHQLREERDAIQTAISLANLQIKQPVFDSSPGTIDHAVQMLNSNIFVDNEDDLIFADLRRFDRGGVLADVSGSTSLYRDRRVTLVIANVNRKPLERALGVDLLYLDVDRNSYIFVQYKRLRDYGRGYDTVVDPEVDDRWRYTNKRDIREQLARMRSLGDHPPSTASDWRIVDNPFWFKFVRPLDYDSKDPRVLTGMYVPSSYLRTGIDSDSFVGPRGGFALGYWNTRYLNRSVFVTALTEIPH